MSIALNITKSDIVLVSNFYLFTLSINWREMIKTIGIGTEKRYNIKLNTNSLAYHEVGKSHKSINSKDVEALFKKLRSNGVENLASISLSLVESKALSMKPSVVLRLFRDVGKTPSYHIYFHTRLDIFEQKEGSLADGFIFLLNQIRNLGEIGYGLFHAMSQEKLPSLYFRGHENNLLTIEEKDKLQIWRANKERCFEKVWDIYLGNILNPKQLLDNKVVTQIQKVVGKQNITLLGDLVLFFLPLQLLEWVEGKEKAKEIKGKLIEIFETNKLLMERVTPRSTSPRQLTAQQNSSRYPSESNIQPQYKGPTYIERYLVEVSRDFASNIEDTFREMTAYSVMRHSNKIFELLIDEDTRHVSVKDSEGTFVLYDPSKHPANRAYERELNPRPREYKCKKCGSDSFEIAVGYEYPEDSEGQDDISWFALGGKCLKCGKTELIFDDETA